MNHLASNFTPTNPTPVWRNPSAARPGTNFHGLLRHDFKRALYRAMLAELEVEEVIEFFSVVPLVVNGKRYQGKELFQYLWQKKAMITTAYDTETDNILEDFLISKGKPFEIIMQKILWLNNNSTHMPGKVLLTWFYPKLESLFNSLDTRDVAVKLITLFNENWIPDLIHRRVKRVEKNGWIESIMVFIPDPSYQEFIAWDLELIGGPQILMAPSMIGLPPFEGFGMIADSRFPEGIVSAGEGGFAFEGEILMLNDQPIGRRVAFSDFLHRRGIDLAIYNPPDIPVIEILQNFTCPRRKRVVLHEGCAYGAPVFLHWVAHKKLRHQRNPMMGNFVADLAREESTHKDDLEDRHQAVLAKFSKASKFIYREHDESLSLDDEHFIKGVPAKIMKSLLSAYMKKGRTEFEYRDFKQDFEISLGQKNSNFEVRFYRLMKRLDERAAPVRIEKTGRGKFCLKVTAEFSYFDHSENG